jgi:hypothetical protein
LQAEEIATTLSFEGLTMTKKPLLTRRGALAATAGAGTAGMLGLNMLLAGAARVRRAPRVNLDDPAERARIRAMVSGSCAAETVYTFCRLHLYLWFNDGNLIPMVSMANLNITAWEPLPSGNYKGKVHEVGVYTKFDTDELIDTWKNPVTGEEREVWQFVGGPLSVEIGPDGSRGDPETEADAHRAVRRPGAGAVAVRFFIPKSHETGPLAQGGGRPDVFLGLALRVRRPRLGCARPTRHQRPGIRPVPEPG